MLAKTGWLYAIVGTILYFVYSLGCAFVFMAMHVGETFFMQNAFVAAFTGSTIVAFIMARRFKRVSIKDEKKLMLAPKLFDQKPRVEFFVLSIACTFSLFATSALAQFFEKLSVDPTEAWMFYINGGIGEEMYWRVLLVSAISVGLASRSKRCYALVGLVIFVAFIGAIVTDLGLRIVTIMITAMLFVAITKMAGERQSFLASAIAVTVSGILFGLAHLGVYADQPEMLLTCGISGAIMAGFFAFTKNPFYNITAHALYNGYAAWFILFG